MTCLKLFLICMFKSPNLAENFTNMAGEKEKEKVELCEANGVRFFPCLDKTLSYFFHRLPRGMKQR